MSKSTLIHDFSSISQVLVFIHSYYLLAGMLIELIS